MVIAAPYHTQTHHTR